MPPSTAVVERRTDVLAGPGPGERCSASVIEAFVPVAVSRLVVGLEPVNMRWREDRIRSYCRDELGLEPDTSTAFLFTNSKRDNLLLYCLDSDGDRLVQKKLEKGAFLLPAPETEGAAYVTMKRSMLSRLFRS